MTEKYSKDSYGAGLYGAGESAASSSISTWSFALDGHQFIFVDLGSQGTYVFDLSTNKWMSWSQSGVVGLAFSDGTVVNDLCLMGSSTDGSIYCLDPDSLDDETGPFETIVTGGVPATARETVECFALYLSGNPSEEAGRYTRLYYSDDNGETWVAAGEDNPVTQTDEISWRSLGLIRYPGRLFQFVDDGALVGIDALTMEGPNGS